MTRLFALAALTTTLMACSTGNSALVNNNIEANGDFASYNSEDSRITGRMAGEMPHVGTFEENNGYGYGYASNDWVDLQLHASGDYGWAMIGLWAMVDEDGEVLIDDGNIIGCTGPEDGWADFDEPAISADIVIDVIEIDGEEFQQIDITAEFSAGTVTAVALVPLDQ